jgi:hypothetical protein
MSESYEKAHNVRGNMIMKRVILNNLVATYAIAIGVNIVDF